MFGLGTVDGRLSRGRDGKWVKACEVLRPSRLMTATVEEIFAYLDSYVKERVGRGGASEVVDYPEIYREMAPLALTL